MNFTERSIRLSTEVLEKIDDAIEDYGPAFETRQKFVELAIDYALASIEEESEMLMLGLEDGHEAL